MSYYVQFKVVTEKEEVSEIILMAENESPQSDKFCQTFPGAFKNGIAGIYVKEDAGEIIFRILRFQHGEHCICFIPKGVDIEKLKDFLSDKSRLNFHSVFSPLTGFHISRKPVAVQS